MFFRELSTAALINRGPPGLFGSSRLHLDILLGRDETVKPCDYLDFNNDAVLWLFSEFNVWGRLQNCALLSCLIMGAWKLTWILIYCANFVLSLWESCLSYDWFLMSLSRFKLLLFCFLSLLWIKYFDYSGSCFCFWMWNHILTEMFMLADDVLTCDPRWPKALVIFYWLQSCQSFSLVGKFICLFLGGYFSIVFGTTKYYFVEVNGLRIFCETQFSWDYEFCSLRCLCIITPFWSDMLYLCNW